MSTATKGETITVQMQLERVTKGALRYLEIDEKGNPKKTDAEGAVVSTIYFRKASFYENAPDKITVTIN